ncbi:MAG: hypothetical protein JSW06_06785 [Thermoplasmatales archaeon]|nr:MAG: hypothetical protein JSW06_06785 [Thermoplasmatales archaeon]
MNQDHSKPIVAACVVHILPENIPFFKDLVTNTPYVERLIIFKESNDKLWIVSQEDNNGPSR